jgi:hypothetical protein
MKPICAIALFLGVAAYGEQFISPATATKRLLVPTNCALIITIG